MTPLPQFFRVRQSFDDTRVADVRQGVLDELATLRLQRIVKPGQSVAITAGSRGIADIRTILAAIVEHLRSLDARPYLVPAMGSHGGATAEGQREVLTTLGITEEACGCPIHASMETAVLFEAPQGFPVHFDRRALEADHVLLCGRVRPHTTLSGRVQSGLVKMMLIGLSNHDGAQAYHRAFQSHGLDRIARGVVPGVVAAGKIVGGVAMVENANRHTAIIAAVPASQFFKREAQLLRAASDLMPRLPFDAADLLIVDVMGKDISGTGMDTNVVGRKPRAGRAPQRGPEIQRIFVRSLSAASHGNAAGIGLADITTDRLVAAIDLDVTRTNCLAAGHVEAGRIPMAFSTDRAAIAAALDTVGLIEPAKARVMWISNTSDLAEVECSSAFSDEASSAGRLEVISGLRDLPLAADGNLPAEGASAPYA